VNIHKAGAEAVLAEEPTSTGRIGAHHGDKGVNRYDAMLSRLRWRCRNERSTSKSCAVLELPGRRNRRRNKPAWDWPPNSDSCSGRRADRTPYALIEARGREKCRK
jgi:hypothetical protein